MLIDEWFKFEKKYDNTLVPETTKTNLSYTDYNSKNTQMQQDDNNARAIEGTKVSSSNNLDEEKQ